MSQALSIIPATIIRATVRLARNPPAREIPTRETPMRETLTTTMNRPATILRIQRRIQQARPSTPGMWADQPDGPTHVPGVQGLAFRIRR
jgi:hypothetical protein